jgi:hypothetical protein
MARVLSLINGVARMIDESSSISIYDESLEVVASGAGDGEINGPITAGTPVTLPASQTYTGEELQIFLNGNYLEDVIDYTFTSSTQVTFTMDLEVGDIVRFRIDRAA